MPEITEEAAEIVRQADAAIAWHLKQLPLNSSRASWHQAQVDHLEGVKSRALDPEEPTPSTISPGMATEEAPGEEEPGA